MTDQHSHSPQQPTAEARLLPGRLSFPASDHDERVEAARRRAAWELGSETWADVILAAYMDPASDGARLDDEQDDD